MGLLFERFFVFLVFAFREDFCVFFALRKGRWLHEMLKASRTTISMQLFFIVFPETSENR
jgi:hypothetical protein